MCMIDKLKRKLKGKLTTTIYAPIQIARFGDAKVLYVVHVCHIAGETDRVGIRQNGKDYFDGDDIVLDISCNGEEWTMTGGMSGVVKTLVDEMGTGYCYVVEKK